MAEGGSLTPTHSRVLVGPGIDSTDGLWYSNLADQHSVDRHRVRWNYAIDPSWPLWVWQMNWQE